MIRSMPASAAAQSSAALSSNLSELDNLLQELSSAQFAVEVDRRSTGSVWVGAVTLDVRIEQDAQLSQRDRTAGCVIVFAKSRPLELGDNDLPTL